MNILGIETSCDETAAAVVRDGRQVLSNVVYSQIVKHQPYGGVVPEIASRCHVEALPDIAAGAVRQAGLTWAQVDAVAVTRGPGLAPALLIGLAGARALARRLDKPLIGVNHLEGHVHSMFLGETAPLPETLTPLLVLLCSGGHTMLIESAAPGRYALLGQTVDDAAGEALDKGAQLMGLGYPGGPAIEKTAQDGNPEGVRFPRGVVQRDPEGPGGQPLDARLCFSYSGLKTALLYHLRDHPRHAAGAAIRDVAAAYQEAVFGALVQRVERALDDASHRYRAFGCVGGVSRNRRLRAMLNELSVRFSLPLRLARMEYCTDNAAMIAGAAFAHARAAGGMVTDGIEVDPAWPLFA